VSALTAAALPQASLPGVKRACGIAGRPQPDELERAHAEPHNMPPRLYTMLRHVESWGRAMPRAARQLLVLCLAFAVGFLIQIALSNVGKRETQSPFHLSIPLDATRNTASSAAARLARPVFHELLALERPLVKFEDWAWADLDICALKDCAYPVLNPSVVAVGSDTVLVAGRGMHGFGVDEAPTSGTVIEWNPMFSSLVVGFYTRQVQNGELTYIPESARYLPNCNERTCLWDGDRFIDPRVFQSASGEYHVLYQTWVWELESHKMRLRRLDINVQEKRIDFVNHTAVVACKNRQDIVESRRDEKNWAPFSMFNIDFVLYSLTPLQVFKIDYESGMCNAAKTARQDSSTKDILLRAQMLRLQELVDVAAYPFDLPPELISTSQRLVKGWLRAAASGPPESLIHLRGGSPGIAFGHRSVLFVCHLTVRRELLPKASALVQRARQSDECEHHGVWRKSSGVNVDHCLYLTKYPNFYLATFVVVEKDAVTGFRVTRMSPAFVPDTGVFPMSKISFPAGIAPWGTDGFLVSYGENDVLPNSFSISRGDVESVLMDIDSVPAHLLRDGRLSLSSLLREQRRLRLR